MSLLLKNAVYIDWSSLKFNKCHIRVDAGLDGKVHFFNPNENIDMHEVSQLIDCAGMHVTKSFAVAHHHIYSGLARGMPAPKKSPTNFLETLKSIWWRLDKSLDKDTIEASALSTALACAKDGCTFVIDHHSSPNYIEGSLEIIAEVFDRIGISHLLCYEITDRSGLDKAKRGLTETEVYLQKRQALVGLHAGFTVGEETMKSAAELMQKYNSGIHIHVAEDTIDEDLSIERYGKRVVERLQDFGILDSPKSILGHCLHLNKDEKRLIADSNAWVVQNMESNLNNNVGFFDGRGLGQNIMLGTDGMHSDMIRSAQYAYFAGQAHDEINFLNTYQRFRRVHHYLDSNKFSGDGANNLVVLNYDSPTDFNADNFLGHFIFGFHGGHVQHVISNGNLIVKDHILQTENENDIIRFTKEQSKRLWERMNN